MDISFINLSTVCKYNRPNPSHGACSLDICTHPVNSDINYNGTNCNPEKCPLLKEGYNGTRETTR